MKLATWNVNSLKVRLPHVLQWLESNPVDVLCLQELKMTDDKFPIQELAQAGYHAAFTGQKTYNGVAILSKHPIESVQKNNPLFEDEHQRIIAATIAGIRIICAYVPNGQAPDTEKFAYKLKWFEAFTRWIQSEMQSYPQLAVLGDYNIAPTDADVHDPSAWVGCNLVSPQERACFENLLANGLTDSFTLFEHAPKTFTWWDYRQLAFRLNKGVRIDHILLSHALKEKCIGWQVDKTPRKWEQASDHAPVIADFNMARLMT